MASVENKRVDFFVWTSDNSKARIPTAQSNAMKHKIRSIVGLNFIIRIHVQPYVYI